MFFGALLRKDLMMTKYTFLYELQIIPFMLLTIKLKKKLLYISSSVMLQSLNTILLYIMYEAE